MDKKEKELNQMIAHFQAVIDAFPFDMWYKDLEGRYALINKSFEEYTKRPGNEILGRKDHELYPRAEADSYMMSDLLTIAKKTFGYYEVDMHNGNFKEEFKSPCYDENGKMIGTVGFNRDITERKISEQALKRSEARFRAIYENSQIGIGIYDSVTGKAIHVNQRMAQIMGRSVSDLLLLQWEEYTFSDDIDENQHKVNLLNQGLVDSFTMDKRFVKPDKTIIWANIIITPFEAEESLNPCHLCMVNDITAQKQAEEETVYLNYHDQLTGLYNRRFYDEELKRLDTERNLPISLIMADVNGLKLTNDAFGHLAGDQLLVKIGEIMKKECRSDDIVARIGGDEFILLLPETSALEAEAIMKRIHDSIQKAKWGSLIFSVSFGFGTKIAASEHMKKIYMLAEDRMYREKLNESRSMRYETIRIIQETLYQKNEMEQRHCERVGELCAIIGNVMGMSPSEVSELETAGLLHDIGKIGIDENLLNKSGSLSKSEREDMERHPEIGYHILSSVNEFASIAEYVLCHHERIDGKGYPRELTDRDIPMQSKIISIADAYDAMTSHRAYKNTRTKAQAIEEILQNAGTQFDSDLATAFIEKVLKQQKDI